MMRIINTLLFAFVMAISLSSSAVPTIEDFTKEPDLRDVAISPNGRYLAKVWNNNRERIVTVNDLELPGKPVIGSLKDNIVRASSVTWANNERLLVNLLVPYDTSQVKRDSEKKKDFDIDDYFMFGRTLSVDVNAKNAVVLMNNERSIKGNVNLSTIHHYLPNDPDHILMDVYRNGINTLYKVNVYDGTSQIVTTGSRFTFMYISDYEGNTRYRFDYLPVAKKMTIYELLPEDKWNLIDTIKLTETDDKEFDAGDLVGLLGEDLVYRKKNEKNGFLELILYKSKEKTYETLVSLPDRDILYPLTDLRSNKIIGYAVDGDYIRYKFFDAEKQSIYDKLVKKIGNSNFYFSSYTESGDKAIVNLYSPENPLSFSLYDIKNDELSFIENAYFNIATKNLSGSATVNYSTRDGKKIHSYLLLPEGFEAGKSYPLIVMPHGGPQTRDRANYDDFAQFMSTRGYIVMKPNFRGSTGLGKEFEEAGYKQWGQLMQDDLTDAVRFMVKKGYADPARVCIVGISYGGYAALMGAIKTPEIFRCSVSINGVTHLRDMIESDARQISDENMLEKYWFQRIGHPKTDKEMLDANSPVLLANKAAVPILLIASTDDQVVPFSQSADMAAALSKNKKEFNFIKVKDAAHNPFYSTKDTKLVYSEVEKFLARYLLKTESAR